jgi:hypothetical protein
VCSLGALSGRRHARADCALGPMTGRRPARRAALPAQLLCLHANACSPAAATRFASGLAVGCVPGPQLRLGTGALALCNHQLTPTPLLSHCFHPAHSHTHPMNISCAPPSRFFRGAPPPPPRIPDEVLASDPDNIPPRSRLFVVVPKAAEAQVIQVSKGTARPATGALPCGRRRWLLSAAHRPQACCQRLHI